MVDAALEEFSRRGFNETSVDNIVARARASKTTFYEFFESKEDCVRVLIEREGGALIGRVVQSALEGHGARDHIRRGIRTFLVACRDHRALARVLVIEAVGVSGEVEEARRDISSRFAQVVEEEVRHAQERDPFYATVDPEVFGWAVVGAVHEAAAHFLAGPADDPEGLADRLSLVFAPPE
jgi:AcrR family transcriptional regulator